MKTTHLLIMTLTTISFIACGDSSSVVKSSNSNNTTAVVNEDSFEKLNIDVNCTSPDTISNYITLKSGDQLIKDEKDSNITILHDQEGVKKVCLESGKVHIRRSSL